MLDRSRRSTVTMVLTVTLVYIILVTLYANYGRIMVYRMEARMKSVLPEFATIQNKTTASSSDNVIHVFFTVVGAKHAVRLNILLKSLLIYHGTVENTSLPCRSQTVPSSPWQLNCTTHKAETSKPLKVIHLHIVSSTSMLEWLLTSPDSVLSPPSPMLWTHYDIDRYIPLVEELRTEHNAGQPGILKLFAPVIISPDVDRVVSVDVDVLFNADIEDLWRLFDDFNRHQAIGITDEQIAFDRTCSHRLSPQLQYANSGVMLMHLNRLRAINWLQIALMAAYREMIVMGVLLTADQSVFNDILIQHPMIAYRIPCEWNVQVYHQSGPLCCPVVWPAKFITFADSQVNYTAASCQLSKRLAKLVHYNTTPKPSLDRSATTCSPKLLRTDRELSQTEIKERFKEASQALLNTPRSLF